MMGNILFNNNATSTLAAPLNSSARTVTLAAGTGVLFPNPTGGDYFVLTFVSATMPGISEIVKVTSMSGDTIVSMVRAQENTTAKSWNAGDYAQNLITAASLYALWSASANSLPTSDPHVAGEWYLNGSFPCQSAG